MRNVYETANDMNDNQARAVIHGYYQVKLGSDYSAQELDSLITEYGVEYLIKVIKRLCLKKHQYKKHK